MKPPPHLLLVDRGLVRRRDDGTYELDADGISRIAAGLGALRLDIGTALIPALERAAAVASEFSQHPVWSELMRKGRRRERYNRKMSARAKAGR